MPIIGAASTVEVTFLAGANQGGSSVTTTDTSMGTQPAHVSVKPPRDSELALWQTTSSDNAFRIACPAGSVIDLHLSYTNRVGGGGTSAQGALSGATAGLVYLRGFDGEIAASSAFVPVNSGGTQ